MFAKADEDDNTLESLSHQTSPDLGCRDSRKRNSLLWLRQSARVPPIIRFLRQAPGAKVMAVLVGEVERGRIAAVSENAGHILGPEAE